MPKSVDQLLDEARAMLPNRPEPCDVFREIGTATLLIDIRGDEQQRRDGLISGSIIIRRNVLEWRCDPASPWRDPRVCDYGQRIVLFCNQGYQSSLAAANLQAMGLWQATDMVGGYEKWRMLGLPFIPYDSTDADDIKRTAA